MKAMVDEGNIKLRPAVELSYIPKKMQDMLVKVMSQQEVSVIDMKMAKQLREISGSYTSPSEELIAEVLCGTYGEDVKPKEAGEKVTISKATYSRYLGGYSKKEANLIMIDCQVKCNKINEKIYKALRGEYENQGVYGDDY